MSAGSLGRLEPTDWKHVDKYPLRALPTADRPAKVPMAMGVNWYANFDEPVKDGRYWWIGRGDLGRIRGGHAVCLVPEDVPEPYTWWDWYNQVSEGICVGEAIARCMSLLNRRRYQPRPLYDIAQDIDEFSSTPPQAGTSVRAGLDVARLHGLVPAKQGERHIVHKNQITRPLLPEHGISANRWATSIDEVLGTLGAEGQDYVEMANSWGKKYPRRVRIPATVLDRLLRESGEFPIVTDR